MTNVESYFKSPWNENVLLHGTDGMQFSPDSSGDTKKINVFVNDLSRNCNFDYSHKDSSFSHIDANVYNMQLANPANENYDTIDGTTNMTSTFKAHSFATKGHYYKLSQDALSSKPIINGADGT